MRRVSAVTAVCAVAASLAAVLPVTLVLAEPATAAAPPGPAEFALDDPTFFNAPNPLPAGEHGDLLRWQPVDTPFWDSYRIMYLSQSVAGAPIAVTGLVSVGEDRAPFGGFDVLLYGHGTIGMADACAPSRVYQTPDDSYSSEGWSSAASSPRATTTRHSAWPPPTASRG